MITLSEFVLLAVVIICIIVAIMLIHDVWIITERQYETKKLIELQKDCESLERTIRTLEELWLQFVPQEVIEAYEEKCKR